MESFVIDFIDSTDPQRSPNDVSNALSQFRIKINPELCRNTSSSDRIKFLISIFDQLLYCCESESSLVRISSFTASTSFLSKMIRSYPTEIQKAFASFATKLVSPRKGSMFIVFSFSYIATFVSGLFFDDFFHSVPFYHHIVNCESSVEDFSHIIQNFPNQMSLENYITILVSFITQYQKDRNSKLLIPIQKIVEKCVLLDQNSNLAFNEVYKSNDITLIAFILTTVNVNSDDFDFHDLALNALQKLKTANLSERDDCLLFLSIKSKSFQVNCKLITFDDSQNDVIRISIDDEFTDLKIKEYSKLPYFYSLFLPNSLLLPDRDHDSHSIIAAKFNTIGRILSDKNQIIDVEEYIKLFCNYIVNDCDPIQEYQKYKQQNQDNQNNETNKNNESNQNNETNQNNEVNQNNNTNQSNESNQNNEVNKNSHDNSQANLDENLSENSMIYRKKLKYDEDVSSALKSFAVSLPCLITNAKNHLLIIILKSIFHTKITSWMHGLDILRVIEAMKDKLLDYISLTDRVNLLLDFAMNPSEKLSSQAINLIVEMTTKNFSTFSSRFITVSNFDEITTQVANSIDFFTAQSLIIKLRLLAEIIKNNPDQNINHLEWVASILSKIYNDYITDLHTLSEIFNFLQFFTNSATKKIPLNQNIIQMNEKLIDISFSILIYSLYHMKGCDYMNKVSSEYSFYSGLVDKYLNSKSIDIVSEHPFNFKLNFPLIANAYAFYISQCSVESSSSRKKTLIFLIELFFEYFPSESTSCLFTIDDILQLSSTMTEFPPFLNTYIASTYYSTPSYSIVLNAPLLATSNSVAQSLISYLFSKLIIVNDPHVFAIWMKNFPKNESLVKYAVYFLENSRHINGSVLNASDFDSFSYFLHGFGIKYESIISNSLIKIDASISADYILLALSHSDFILKYNKEINMNSAAFRENFDNMEDKFKMDYIKRYIIFAEDGEKRKQFGKKEETTNDNKNAVHVVITKSLIDYGMKNLKGWEKMTFLLKCQEKLQKQKQPKFDFEFKDIPNNDCAFNTFFKMNIKDRIQSLLQFYIYTNNIEWIEHILRLSVIKNQSINFNNENLLEAIRTSSEAIVIISRFIKKRNKILKLHKKQKQILQTEETKIPAKIKPPFNANMYLQYLYSKTSVKKREIVQAYKLINLIDPQSTIIFDFYRKFHSTHVKTNLALLSGFISHARSIEKKSHENGSNKKIALDSDFVEFFFQNIQNDAKEENIGYASITAYLVITTYMNITKQNNNNNNDSENEEKNKALSEKVMLSIRHLFGICGLNSVELSTLYSTLIAVIFENNININKSNEEAELKAAAKIEKSSKSTEKDKDDDIDTDAENNKPEEKTTNDSNVQKSSVVINDLNEALSHFINGEAPSQVQAGVRIISRSISSMREQSIEIIEPVLENLITKTIQLCSSSSPTTSISIYSGSSLSSATSSSSDFLINNVDIVLKFSRCGNCPFIAQNVAKLLRTILQSRAFLKLYPIIASNSIKLCEISHEFATNLTGVMIKRLHQTEQLYYVFCKLLTNQFDSKSSSSKYLSIDDLHFYIECFTGIVKKITENDKKESILLNYVYMFIQSFEGYDNWALFDVYLAWADFIEKNLDIDNIDKVYGILFKTLSEQFIPHSPRFFPIFAVFALKAIKYMSIESKDPSIIEKRKEILGKAIDNAVSLIQNDAHIYALKSLKKGDNLKEALDIAQLEMDEQ